MHPATRLYLFSYALEVAGVAFLIANFINVPWWIALVIFVVGYVGRLKSRSI